MGVRIIGERPPYRENCMTVSSRTAGRRGRRTRREHYYPADRADRFIDYYEANRTRILGMEGSSPPPTGCERVPELLT